MGADGTRARVVGWRGWGRAWLLAGCVLLIGSGACTRALEFDNRGTGGGTGTGGVIGTGGTGTGGVTGTGTGGTGAGGTGTGGTGTGGMGTGGTGPVDARVDLPRDVQPDIRDTGP